MRRFFLATTVSLSAILPIPGSAQGVPTFDGSQLGQLVAQLEHMATDLNVQLQQLATMRQELETQISQLLNLEAQLKSLMIYITSVILVKLSLRLLRKPLLAYQAKK